jgi:hypothetical protein
MTNNYLEGAIEPSARMAGRVEVWLGQQIWGHRMYNDQTPWFLLLEALGVMASRAQDKNCDAVFPGPMELEAFLQLMWERYRVVVGAEVGRQAFTNVNYAHLKANQRLLEERLRVLGLLKRLSDDCAFVSNPFVGSRP